MVFCGRPSKSCANCRKRRIKCDQVEPACSQCLRAKKICPGYRDQLALLFREQSEEVARKVSSQRTHNSKKGNWTSPVPENPPKATHSPTISSVEEEGIRFVLERYLNFPLFAPGNCLRSSVLNPNDRSHNVILDAMTSVGLAGLAHVKNDGNLMVTARHKYLSALRTTMASIHDSVQVELSQTLRVVILLSIFESVTCDTSSRDAWASHFDGAAAILKVRSPHGPRQSDEAINALLIWFQIAIGCIQRRKNLPLDMIEYPESCRVYLSEVEQPACSLASIFTRFIAMWASRGHQSSAHSDTIIQYALGFESDLKNWAMELPESWAFRPVPSSGEVFNGYMEHDYPNRFIANSWSWYRTIRMLVNEVLVEYLTSRSCSAAEYELRLADSSMSTLSQLSREICSSASFFLQDFDTHRDTSRFHIHGAFTLLWPLKVVGSSRGSSEALHLWAVGTLQNIWQCLGIRMALEMANQVTEDRRRMIFPV
ncbi:uncharacterized protein V1513DRAFT_442536 [Lipomyces chichibuensis]|uniref:uncharacterized protein n=1 Tax=Lipomyces chichibuensis TaxID=1546026 RepID=UPI003343B37E